MFPELHALERVCARTPGSLKRLVLIDPGDLSATPAWHIEPSIDDLEFSPGAGAYDFQLDRLTGRLDDNTVTTNAAGDFFEYNLSARVRTVRVEAEYLRAKLRNRRVHAVVTDYAGTQRYLPNIRLTARADTGGRPSDRNGYTISGSLRLHKPAPFLNASIDVIGGPYVPPTPTSPVGGVLMVPITTTDSSYTYQVPAGYLLAFVYVRSDEAQTVSLGTTVSGAELGGPLPLDADQYGIMGAGLLRPASNTNIYLSGLAGTNSIEIWLLSGS